MKHVFAGTCLAAAFAVSLAAQSTAQPPAPSASDRDDKDKVVTLTGCVRAGEEPSSFVLANVKLGDKSTEPSATGTSGTTGAPKSPESAMLKDLENATVELKDAPASVSLAEHVGHTVQVTGTLDKDNDHAMASPAPATAGAAGTAAGSATGTSGTAGEQTGARSSSTAKPERSLKVRTVTMIAATCTPIDK